MNPGLRPDTPTAPVSGPRPFPFRSGRLASAGALAILCLAVGLLYGHTLHVPWYLDDYSYIVRHFALRDLGASLGRVFTWRGVAYLSFALDYRLAGLSLPAFHATNLAVHLGSSFLVHLILRRLLGGLALPTTGALLFAAHPLQTQAVTYVWQRVASLCGFLFLLSFFCWLRAAEAGAQGSSRPSPRHLLWYGASLTSGVLAVFTKENAATLPLVLLAFERLMPRPHAAARRSAALGTLPFFLPPLALWLLATPVSPGASGLLTANLASLRGNSPLHYLATQLSVVWVYLRLFLVPYGQALEHNFPIVQDVLTARTVVALGALLALGAAAWRWRKRRPLAVFGLAWFFLTLAVESSVIPLDPLFEHRLYLPSFGLVLALLDGLRAVGGERAALLTTAAAALACAPLTWERNELWNDPVAFYEDNLRKAPDSERVLLELAAFYRERGKEGEARELLERALAVNPEYVAAWRALADLHVDLGMGERAVELLDGALRQAPRDANLYGAAAALRLRLGQPEAAAGYTRAAIALAPRDPEWLNNLGVLFAKMGRLAKAERCYRERLSRFGPEPAALDNLGKALFRQGRVAEALAQFRLAAELDPGNPEPLLNLGIAALEVGDEETVAWAAAKLERADRGAWEQLEAERQARRRLP